MLLDMRSASEVELKKLETKVLGLLDEAANEENARWNSTAIKAEIKLVGDRPAGQQEPTAPIVQVAWAATEAANLTPEFGPASSTDANLPMSLGIPAIRLCGGGAEGNNHSLDEWYDPTDGYRGPQKLFMTVLGLVGVAGLSEPLLPNANSRNDRGDWLFGQSPQGFQVLAWREHEQIIADHHPGIAFGNKSWSPGGC
jgi:hypothetical protein